MFETDRKSDDPKIMVTIVLFHCINYNTFLVTLFIQPFIIIVSAFMFYSAQVKIYRDPYNGQLMKDHPTEYIQDQITLILILIFSTTVHHYLV